MQAGLAILLLAGASGGGSEASPTEQLLLERLSRLERRVGELETRNGSLEQQLAAAQAAPVPVPVPLPVPVPAIAAHGPDAFVAADRSSFTFRPHMVFQQDAAAFFGKRGGYDFKNGALLRHASIWAEGDYGPMSYGIVLDLPNGTVSVTDAWLRYRLKPDLFVTAGLHKAPFGFQFSNNDNFDIFIERSMFGNAAASMGSGRRVGLSGTFQTDRVTLAGGVFGDNGGLARTLPGGTMPGDSSGIDGRLAWRPVLGRKATVSLGLSGYHRESLRVGGLEDAVRFTDRPNIRVDGGNIADSGIVTHVKSLDYAGAEAVGILGPVLVSGEYGSAWLRRAPEADVRFDGYYAMGSLFLTGEHYRLDRGQLERLRPLAEIGKGGSGALEVTLRYDRIDLSRTPVLANAGNRASSITAGINWYLTPYAKLLVNFIRFEGTNSPLDPVGTKVKADTIATRLHVDM